MDVTETILNFKAFLVAGYANWLRSAQAAVARNNGFIDEAFCDWAQANWELLVERALCGTGQYLDIYASGSDYEMQLHSRVFFREAKPTHAIRCELMAGASAIDLLSDREIQPSTCSFDRFVARNGTWYEDEPPFDYVMLDSDDTQHVLPVSSVRFVLQEHGTRPNNSFKPKSLRGSA